MIHLVSVNDDIQKCMVRKIIENHHSYVPTSDSVGRRIDWLIYNEEGNEIPFGADPIGMIGIGSGVYPPPKDILRYLGLTKEQYRQQFNSFANNWRFCVTEKVENAGTQILSRMRRLAPVEWYRKYGDVLRYIVTFVGNDKHGGVYLASSWKQIGETSGLPSHKSTSMKWSTGEELKEKFVKPTGENKKIIFIVEVPKILKKKEKPPTEKTDELTFDNYETILS